MPAPLPIDEHLPRIVDTLRRHRAVVVVAPPGSGKTTRLAPALVDDGPVVLLQPRRVAARALAQRIAVERGWSVGREVGWQVRFERRFGPDTKLLVATEGVLTVRLQRDPLLGEFRTVILDEFHERSIHADLALALVRQAALARGDLNVAVLSATLDAEPVAAYLGGCPILEIEGRTHPVAIEHAPGRPLSEAVLDEVRRGDGHVLAFLPGAGEIGRARRELATRLGPAEVELLELHGSLDAEAQDRALAPSAKRKVILATNLAETSLTVDGVTSIVDGGLVKVLRRDPSIGIDRLEIERISADSAEQRAGRAGRTGPGRAVRLWDARDELRPHREPEILRADLAAPLLDILLWGADPSSFAWFEAPPPEAVRQDLQLLERLGAVANGRATPLARELRRLPLHPRLARLLLDCGGSAEAAAACAALAEGWRPKGQLLTSRSDLWAVADRVHEAPARVRSAAAQLERALPRASGASSMEAFLRAVLAAYPDRVARRREPTGRETVSPRMLLASGHGALLAPESGVRDEFVVAVDWHAGERGPGSEARIRLASAIEPDWLTPTASEVVHLFDERSRAVRATERTLHGAIVLAEKAVEPDPVVAATMLAEHLLSAGLGPEAALIVRRLRFAGSEVDVTALVERACQGRTELPPLELEKWLPAETRRSLEARAPASLTLPSGRRVSLDYREDGSVAASVKLQELFGLEETPRVGPRKEPVLLHLLAPNGRPVQTTRDLRSFWANTYPQVRRELRGRYPKHAWPEDPR